MTFSLGGGELRVLCVHVYDSRVVKMLVGLLARINVYKKSSVPFVS